jgi:hypothetical protein
VAGLVVEVDLVEVDLVVEVLVELGLGRELGLD